MIIVPVDGDIIGEGDMVVTTTVAVDGVLTTAGATVIGEATVTLEVVAVCGVGGTSFGFNKRGGIGVSICETYIECTTASKWK